MTFFMYFFSVRFVCFGISATIRKSQEIRCLPRQDFWWCFFNRLSPLPQNRPAHTLSTKIHKVFRSFKVSKYEKFKKVRRVELITRFSKNAFKCNKYSNWFCKSEESNIATRSRAPLLKPVQCRTQRYSRTSIPVMTKLLSWHPPLPYVSLDLA